MGFVDPNVTASGVTKSILETGQLIADMQLVKDTGGAETDYFKQTIDVTDCDNLVIAYKLVTTAGTDHLKIYVGATEIKDISITSTTSETIEVIDTSSYTSDQAIRVTLTSSNPVTMSYFKMWSMEA